jgi:hypothetical protein
VDAGELARQVRDGQEREARVKAKVRDHGFNLQQGELIVSLGWAWRFKDLLTRQKCLYAQLLFLLARQVNLHQHGLEFTDDSFAPRCSIDNIDWGSICNLANRGKPVSSHVKETLDVSDFASDDVL